MALWLLRLDSQARLAREMGVAMAVEADDQPPEAAAPL